MLIMSAGKDMTPKKKAAKMKNMKTQLKDKVGEDFAKFLPPGLVENMSRIEKQDDDDD